MQFGDYLRQRRTELGWTQPEAAARVQIEQSYLSKLENGKSIPSGDVYHRLVDAYAIDATAMVGALFPSELDRLREIDALRDVVLAKSRRGAESPRRQMLLGIAALAVGGGFIGYSMVDPGGTLRQYTYQSSGVIAVNAPADTEIDPDAPGADERTRFLAEMRGPMFTEQVPNGKRIWMLVGSNDIARPPRHIWALIPGIALIVGGLGCFFAASRWR
jgi:transcriptional regulator with XRE-family HTH domain